MTFDCTHPVRVQHNECRVPSQITQQSHVLREVLSMLQISARVNVEGLLMCRLPSSRTGPAVIVLDCLKKSED
jgi:hypothetical protein